MNGERGLTVIDSEERCKWRPSLTFVSKWLALVKTLKRTFLSYLFVINVACDSYFGV